MFPHLTCMIVNKGFNNWRVTADDGANVTVSKMPKYWFFFYSKTPYFFLHFKYILVTFEQYLINFLIIIQKLILQILFFISNSKKSDSQKIILALNSIWL